MYQTTAMKYAKTVRCHYNAIQYDIKISSKILYTILQNTNQSLYSHKAPHTLPLPWGVFCRKFGEIYCVIMTLHSILKVKKKAWFTWGTGYFIKLPQSATPISSMSAQGNSSIRDRCLAAILDITGLSRPPCGMTPMVSTPTYKLASLQLGWDPSYRRPISWIQRPFLLTWINLNPSMNK